MVQLIRMVALHVGGLALESLHHLIYINALYRQLSRLRISVRFPKGTMVLLIERVALYH